MALTNRVEIPESKALAPDVDKVISIVCEHYNVTKKEILYSLRGTENSARDIATYLVRRLCCKTLPDVDTEFGITNYSNVSSVVQRVKKRIENDRILQKELRIIEGKSNQESKADLAHFWNHYAMKNVY